MAFLPTPQLPIGQCNRIAESSIHPISVPVRVAVRATADRPVSVTRRRRLLDFVTIFSSERVPEDTSNGQEIPVTRPYDDIRHDLLKRYSSRQELLRRHTESVRAKWRADREASRASAPVQPSPSAIDTSAPEVPIFSTPYSPSVRRKNFSISPPSISSVSEPSGLDSGSPVQTPDAAPTPSPSASSMTAAVVDAPTDVVPEVAAPSGLDRSSVSVPSVGDLSSPGGEENTDDVSAPPKKSDLDLVKEPRDTVAVLYSPPAPTKSEGTDVQDVAVEEPVAEEPVVEEPEPATEESAVKEPMVAEPIVEEPVAEAPVIAEPVVDEPVVEEPVVEEPVTEAPMIEEPSVEVPVAEESIAEAPVIEDPVGEAKSKEEGGKEQDGAVQNLGKVLLDAIVDGVTIADSDSEPQDLDGHKEHLLELVKSGKLRNLTVMKLKRLLSIASLKTSGRKSELIARLISYAKSK